MKKMRIGKKGKKGLTGVEISVILVMGLITLVMTTLIPTLFLKKHIVRVVEIQYGYNNAELTLLTLVSDRSFYKVISLYIAGFGDNTEEGFSRAGAEAQIKSRLDQLVPSGCYKLSYDGGEILSQELSEKKCDTEFSVTADIVLPYGEIKVKKLTLEISTDITVLPEMPREICCLDPVTLQMVCATEENCIDAGWEPRPPKYDGCKDSTSDCVVE